MREFLIARYARQPNGKPYAAATRQTVSAVLSDFFNHAVRTRQLTASPMLWVGRPRRRRGPRRRVMPLAQVEKLIQAAGGRDRIALRLLLELALRREELRLIQFRDFDLDNRLLTLAGAKGGGYPLMPFGKSLARAVERETRYRGPDEYLLTSRMKKGRPLTTGGIHHWWKRRLKLAGLSGTWKMHELRHTAITEYIRANAGDLMVGKEFARHSSISTTVDIYGHLADAARIKARGKFEARVAAAIR